MISITVQYKNKSKTHLVNQQAVDDAKSCGVDIVAEIASALLSELEIELVCEIIDDTSIDAVFKCLQIKQIYNDIRSMTNVKVDVTKEIP